MPFPFKETHQQLGVGAFEHLHKFCWIPWKKQLVQQFKNVEGVFAQDELEKHLYNKGENTQGWNKNDTSWISIMEKNTKDLWLILDMLKGNGCQREINGGS
jgi:hypothetical protein